MPFVEYRSRTRVLSVMDLIAMDLTAIERNGTIRQHRIVTSDAVPGYACYHANTIFVYCYKYALTRLERAKVYV